jgi:hypothetical protein
MVSVIAPKQHHRYTSGDCTDDEEANAARYDGTDESCDPEEERAWDKRHGSIMAAVREAGPSWAHRPEPTG